MGIYVPLYGLYLMETTVQPNMNFINTGMWVVYQMNMNNCGIFNSINK